MKRYAFPRIGRRPVSEVNTADVLEILTPIWHVKAATAREVRQRIRSVLEWAIALDMRNDNPCVRDPIVQGTGFAILVLAGAAERQHRTRGDQMEEGSGNAPSALWGRLR